MDRRTFISMVGGSVLTMAVVAKAQQPAMPVVGVLSMQTPESETVQLAAIRQGLKEAGFVEGQNVAFDLRFAEGRNDLLPTLAAELVRRRVTLIVASTTPPALAAKAATSSIPIVFAFGADPVELGLVATFNRPGANITGVAFLVNKLVEKRLELLAEVVPKTKPIGMLVDPNNPNAESDVKYALAAAVVLGRRLIIAKAGTQNDLDGAFATLVENRVAALFVAPNANFRIWRNRLLALVAQHKLPASYSNADFVRAGGLMSYGPDQADVYRLAGLYAGRILKGEKPAELPVLQPTKFELVINLKTAKTLGLTIPQSVLLRADQVIE
jgi:putative tryptophan/tyrosine transport system substrate-binding protein